MPDNQILVFPRMIFGDVFSLLPWDSIQDRLGQIESAFSWMNRADAEKSIDLVQAIPCACIRDRQGRYCILRRVKSPRSDLSKKLSLVVGGHIDEPCSQDSFQTILSLNLLRELEEEVGIFPDEIPDPIGVIIDDSSIQASRHVAFLHELESQQISPKASEEFAMKSKYSGMFADATQLAKRHREFDPWSKLLIEEYICRGDVLPNPRQHSFL